MFMENQRNKTKVLSRKSNKRFLQKMPNYKEARVYFECSRIEYIPQDILNKIKDKSITSY